MNALRAVLIVVGVAAGVYGAVLIWDFRLETIVRIAVWAGAGVILHDFVFAPLCAVLGWTGRRLIRGRWWTPVVVAGVCSATLVALAIPVYDARGAKPDNPTVLDRNYPVGLMISLALVWACVPLYWGVVSMVSHRRGVDQPGRRSGSA